MRLIICAFSYKNTIYKISGEHIRKDIFRAVKYALNKEIKDIHLISDVRNKAQYKGNLNPDNVIQYIKNKIKSIEDFYKLVKESENLVLYFTGHLIKAQLLFNLNEKVIGVDNSFIKNHQKALVILDCCYGNTFYTFIEGIWIVSTGKARFKEGSIFTKYVFYYLVNENNLNKINILVNNKIREKNPEQSCLIINYSNLNE